MILILIPFSANDAVLLERNLDHIYRMNGRKSVGHALLVANQDVHPEMRSKVKITAELAFETVSETTAAALEKEYANHKVRQMNNLFRHGAKYVQENYRCGFLWLEPDCVPVKPEWIAALSEAYRNQPKKHFGVVTKNSSGRQIMARWGIYANTSHSELDKLCQTEAPFASAIADKIVPGAGHTTLIDFLPIQSVDDIAKISAKAVIVHGDKLGIVAENWKAPADISLAIDTETVERFLKMPEEELRKHKMTERQHRMFMERVSVFTPQIQPQEVANTPENVPIKNGDLPPENTPRLNRRQKREMEQAKV